MKILKLSPYYSPEQISSSHLTNDLEKAYVEAGHEIEIYCPTPTRGVTEEIRREYSNKKYEEKYNGRIKIHRFSMFKEGRSPIQRAVRYILVNIIQFYKGCMAKDIDIIIAGSTPPTQGVLCGLLKKVKGIPFIYTLQDIFPDSLVNAKMTKKGSIIWEIGRVLEAFTYKSADRIIVISEDFKKNIMDKGVPEDKIEVIPNWVNTDNVYPIERKNNILFERYHLDKNKFYICYSGNIGHTQNLELLLAVAEEIGKMCKDIHFVIIGEGVAKDELSKRIVALGLENIILLPFQPYSDIAHVFSLGDVGLLISKPGVGGSSVPSKTWSYMAAGKPIIASFDLDSKLCDLLTTNKCGLIAAPNSSAELIEKINLVFQDKIHMKSLGDNGKKYITNILSKNKCTQRYLEVISKKI